MKSLQFIHTQVILLGLLIITSSTKAQITSNTNKVVDNLSSYSVSLSDDTTTLAIGTHQANSDHTKSGRVRIYKKNLEGWSQIGEDIYGETEGDWSGYSVSLSSNGTTVAIGAKRNHGRNGVNSGHVRVYENKSGVWKQVGGDIDGEAQGDWSGYSVSLSKDGSAVAIGAVLNSNNGECSGHVRVYKNNSGKWIQVGKDINGKAAKDYFGASVSLSGNMLAVGAHQGGTPSGYVSIYKNISGHWVQIGEDIKGEPTGNFSGWNISLSNNGNAVAIAAYNNNDEKRYAYVRSYQNKSGIWIQQGVDIDGKSMRHNLSGLFNNINLGNDGTITLIGAYEAESNKNKHTPGISYVGMYRFKESSNIWANTQI